MSYPNNPSEDPYGQGYQPGHNDGSGGYPGQHPGQPGGYPAPGGQQPGGYPPPPQGDPSQGYQSGGYPPPHGDPSQGYPGGAHPGHQQGGYPPPGQPGGYPGQDQAGGYPAPGYPQGGYPPPGGQPGYGQPGYGQPGADDRQMAFLAHLGGGILGVLVPLIIFLVKKDSSPFVRQQSLSALNFQLVLLIGYIVSSVLSFIFIGALLGLGIWIFAVVVGLQRGQAVNRGEMPQPYPITVTWVK